MKDINDFLLPDAPPVYDVTQPSVLDAIGKKGIRRATVIKDCAFTITARQDRTPAQAAAYELIPSNCISEMENLEARR